MPEEIRMEVTVNPTVAMAAAVDVSGGASESNAEAWAVGQRGGVDVPSTDVTYHNNAKYYAQQSGAADAVRYSAQDLTAAEQAQARKNIGAAGTEELDTLGGVYHTLNVTWQQGGISYAGANFNSSTRIRTPAYYSSFGGCVMDVRTASGYEAAARIYTSLSPAGFVGNYPTEADGAWAVRGFRLAVPAGYYVRFLVRKTGDANIAPADGETVSIYRINGLAGNLAPYDTETAENTYAVGDLLTVGGTLYKATQAIAPGDAIAEGTNVTETTVAAQLAEQGAAIAAETAAREAAINNLVMSPTAFVMSKIATMNEQYANQNFRQVTVIGNRVIVHRTSNSGSTYNARAVIGGHYTTETDTSSINTAANRAARFREMYTAGAYVDLSGMVPFFRSDDVDMKYSLRFCKFDGMSNSDKRFGFFLGTYNPSTDVVVESGALDVMPKAGDEYVTNLYREFAIDDDFITAANENHNLMALFCLIGGGVANTYYEVVWSIEPRRIYTT